MAEISRWQMLDLLNREGPLWLTGVDLSGLNLSRANLQGADLEGANLTGTHLAQLLAGLSPSLKDTMTGVLAASVEAIGRNPGAVGPIRITMIIGLALIESLVIYALIIAFLILA